MRALKSERNTRIFHMNITYNNVNLCIIYHLLSSQIKLDGALWYWLRLNKVYHECGTSKCSVFFFFFLLLDQGETNECSENFKDFFIWWMGFHLFIDDFICYLLEREYCFLLIYWNFEILWNIFFSKRALFFYLNVNFYWNFLLR